MQCRHVLVLLLCVIAGTAARAQTDQSDKTSWQGSWAPVRAPHIAVARDAEAWQRLWRDWLDSPPPRALPEGSIGAAVFLGPRRTGGHGVEIVGIEPRDCVDVVRFAEHTPAAGAIVTQAFTTPWAIAILPGSSRPIVFERRQATGDSQPVLLAPEGMRLVQMSEICAARRAP